MKITFNMSDYRIEPPLLPKCAIVLHASDEKPLSRVSLLKDDNRLTLFLDEWKEFYASLPFLLDDASSYICNGPWRTDDECDGNYDFVWPDDGFKKERDLHDSLLTTADTWEDVSLQMTRFVIKPIIIRMPNFEVRAFIAVRTYTVDKEGKINPRHSRYGLNLTLQEVITLIRSRGMIQDYMDAHVRRYSVRPSMPPELPPAFIFHRHLFG